MGIEGNITVQMTVFDERVKTVKIESSRPVHASKIFLGKSNAVIQEMIPLLFHICGTAQSCANIRAVERAMDWQVSDSVEIKRDALVNMESLREHLWRIFLDWPSFVGIDVDHPAMAEMISIQRSFQKALCPDGNLFQPEGHECQADLESLNSLNEQLQNLLMRKVFCVSTKKWLEITSPNALFHWVNSTDTIAAQLIQYIQQQRWSDSGACESKALPVLDEHLLDAAMRKADFISQPKWSGSCCETTSLTRVDSPLLDKLKLQYSNGLLVRIIARLTEIAQLAELLLSDKVDTRPSYKENDCKSGIGRISAARGELIHRVELTDGQISDYQILAPTEWNFHPDGVVKQALVGLQGNAEQIEIQARMLINAIDPCVGYKLIIHQDSQINA